MSRTILLADMNAFFASVHQALDPSLRDKPVIVAGDPAKRHGVVLAASYEAKAKGVKTGMTMGETALEKVKHTYYRGLSQLSGGRAQTALRGKR